jgi:filamentous hemagglutinin family protein
MSKSCLKSAGNNAVTSHPRPALLRNKLCVAILLAIAGPAYALPQGGQVVAGDVAIAVSGDTMDIQQNSQRAILDFHSFDIADQQTVNFHQPGADAVALNRVLGDRLSEIHGALNASGQVYLINPNGVVFGNGAEINVGSLVVTTLGMTDQDFLAGRDAFSGGAEGRIENDGSIHAQDRVVLLAPEVVNRGDIQVPDGDIVLRSSRQALLHTAGSEIPILVDDADLVGRVTNEGSLRAGEIALVLDGSGRGNVYDSAINNSGLVRAVKGSGEGGEIHLLAATGVVNSGVLDASAEQGDGGTVSIISDSINQSGSINATAAGEGKGGQIDLLASHSIAMHSGSSIDASADREGDSGDVVIIAEKSTWLTGDASIKARGGEESGDGGFVEVSGREFIRLRVWWTRGRAMVKGGFGLSTLPISA